MNHVYFLQLMLCVQLKLYVAAIPYTCVYQEFCPPKTKHVACAVIEGFSKKCGSTPHTFLPVNGFLKENILQHVNVLRNMVASGLYGMKPAARMPAMAWDKYLAKMATRLAFFCDRKGKMCANSQKYRYVATVKISGIIKPKKIGKQILDRLLPVMLNDALGCQMNSDGRIFPVVARSCVGHFLPLIEDKGNRMGCAIRVSTYKKKKLPRAVLICNFSRANVEDMPHYQISTVPGSNCSAGPNPIYKYLCHPKEVVDANYVLSTKMNVPPYAGNSSL